MAPNNHPPKTTTLLRRLRAHAANPKPLLEKGKITVVETLDAHGLHAVSRMLFKTKRLAVHAARPARWLLGALPHSQHRGPEDLATTVNGSGGATALLTPAEEAEQRTLLLKRSTHLPVSVVMPTWNRAAVIGAAIESVLAQSYEHFELWVVDDGSTDDTRAVVERYQDRDPRVHYTATDHEGVSAARNVALERCRGAFVAYLDSDNVWRPDYLLHMVHGLLDTGRLTAYCAQQIVDSEDPAGSFVRFAPFHLGKLRQNNYIDLNVFMHRRDLFDHLGGFDRDLKRWVDWDVILRYTEFCEPHRVPIVLCDYHRSTSLNQITFAESATQKYKVLHKHLIRWRQQALQAPLREPGLVSIVIPVFNQARLTERCLQSITTHTRSHRFEIVVVNNASSDHTAPLLAALSEHDPRLSVVTNYENYGFALACNLGVANSHGEYVVLLNNDTEVTPGWLEHLIADLEEDETLGIVGPKLLFPDGTLQSGGMAFNTRSKIPYNIYQGFPGTHPAINKRRTYQAVTGACWALRATDFIALRGFDVTYLNGGEDIDFCFRLATEHGKHILYNPTSVVYHYEGRTEGRGKNIMANRRLFVERWRDHVVADDRHVFEEDGFEVTGYHKKGTEPHGETAAYYPIFSEKTPSPAEAAAPAGSRQEIDSATIRSLELPPITSQIERQQPRRTLRVGFSTIWHARGISFHTKQLADCLEGRGFETYIFARWESDRFQNDGPISHSRVFNGGDDPTPEAMLNWAREAQLDLVVFMEVHPKDWKRVQRLKESGIHVMGYENLDILRTEFFDRYAIFDSFLFCSFTARSIFEERFPDARGVTLPWGVHLHLAEEGYRPVDMEDIQLVHVAGWGGLNNRKNTGLVLDAFHEAALPNATLRLFTQAPLSAYGDEHAERVRDNPRIQVHEGTVDDIMQAYEGVDLLLFPSKREGLGLPIVEALAHGIPVLTTDGYMMKQWAIPEKHCLLCTGEEQRGMMYLPEMKVERGDLVWLLKRVATTPALLPELKLNVFRDRSLWRWTWQPDTFAELVRRLIEESEVPAISDLSYLPEVITAHEDLRTQVDGGLSPGAPCSGHSL